jgi:hypothetical protein
MIMKKLIISAAAIVFFMLGASDVFGCSCLVDNVKSERKKVTASYKQATAVFYGEVTEVIRRSDSLLVKFKVEIMWKGISTKEIVIRTAEHSAMCGFNFEVGNKYLVYAGGKSENLQTNICTRTSAQDADAKYLNKIKKPTAFDRESNINNQ